VTTDIIERLRRENPTPARSALDPDALFAAIVAHPADREALAPARRRRSPRAAVAFAALALLVLGAGAAIADGIVDPQSLFDDNPAQSGQALGPLSRSVVPGTARAVTTATVPGVGTVAIWTAQGTKDGLCLAARLPDGSWAATDSSQADGTVPGCVARRTDMSDVLIDTGFEEREADFFHQVDGHATGYRLWYGAIEDDLPATAVQVTDRRSGVSSPVVEGRYFAFVLRDPTGDAATISLVAHDAAGNVVADERAAGEGVSP
jgi:hypothetical protein